MNTSGRRQRQARNGYKDLSKQRRPIYKKPDAAKSARRMRQSVEKQKKMQMNKAGGKK